MPKDMPAVAIERDTSALIELIVTRYHRVHMEDLAEALVMAEAVELVHAANPACPRGLATLLAGMAGHLEAHHRMEERVLFPLMLRTEGSGLPLPMTNAAHDHDGLEQRLEELVRLTGFFSPPGDACVTWRELCRLTAKLYADLREHIRLETQELFPRFDGQIAPAQRQDC